MVLKIYKTNNPPLWIDLLHRSTTRRPSRITLVIAERSARASVGSSHRRQLGQPTSSSAELVLVVTVLLRVPAGAALALVSARHLRLVALAVVLQAVRLLAMAALLVLTLHLRHPPTLRGHSDLGLEGVRVSVEAGADGLAALVLVLDVVEAVLAVAVQTELAEGEALTVELQTLGFGAVARLLLGGRLAWLGPAGCGSTEVGSEDGAASGVACL